MSHRTLPLWAAALALAIPATGAAQYGYDHPHPSPGYHALQGQVLQIPHGARVVDASGMRHIRQIAFVPSTVEVLILRGTQVRQLPNLPVGLRVLDISQTPIQHLPYVPSGLRELRARRSELRLIGYLPNGLLALDVSGSPIVQLPNLPSSLRALDVSRTPMRALPPLPARLAELHTEGSHVQVGYLPAPIDPFAGPDAYGPVYRPRRARWSRRWGQRPVRRHRARVRVRRPAPDDRRTHDYRDPWSSDWERARRRRAYD